MGEFKTIPLFSDRPEAAASSFHFDNLSRAMIGMLARTDNPTPFVFLIDGKWGAGKTSLMKTIIAELEPAVRRQDLRFAEAAAKKLQGNEKQELDAKIRNIRDWPLHFAPRGVIGGHFNSPFKSESELSEEKLAIKKLEWFKGVFDEHFKRKKAKETEERIEGFFSQYRPVRTIFFNAWKYKDEGEIFPALTHELLAAMRADGWLASLQAAVQEVGSTEWREAVAKLAEAVPHAGGALATVIERPSWLREIALYDRARPYIQGLTAAWAGTYALQADNVPDLLRNMLLDDVRNVGRYVRALRAQRHAVSETLPGIVAVFVDDLDRCPKEHVNEILKAINLLVDMESSAWVLGADQERVAEAVEAAYRLHGDDGNEGYGSRFLSKIVQLHVTLPEGNVEEMRKYLNELLGKPEPEGGGANGQKNGVEEDLIRVLNDNRSLLECGLPPNPREVKRLLNAALMRLALLVADEKKGETLSEKRRALLVYLLVASELPASLRSDPDFLMKLQAFAAEGHWSFGDGATGAAIRRSEKPLDLDHLAGLVTSLEEERARRVIRAIQLDAWHRMLGVFGAAQKGGYGLTEALIRDFAAFGGGFERAVVAAVEDDEALAQEERAEKQKQKERQIAATDFVRGLVSALARDDVRGDLRTFIREQNERLTDPLAESVVEALGEQKAEELENIAKEGQRILRLAFDDVEVAENRVLMGWSLFLRDRALERLARKRKSTAGHQNEDLFVARWGQEESKPIKEQRRSGIDAQALHDCLKKETHKDGSKWVVDTAGDSEEVNPIGARLGPDEKWMLIPPGPFLAGGVDENREKRVRIERESVNGSFLIAEDPVKVEEFKKFLDAHQKDGKYDFDREWWSVFRDEALEAMGEQRKPAEWDEKQKSRPDHPVVGVSWFEAAAYCRWLNQERTGSADGPYRLPTEAEWEKAARGLFGRRWPWGGIWRPELVVCRGGKSAEKGGVMAVEENPNRSPFGVRGMAGNCWEWCEWEDHTFGEDLITEKRVGSVKDGDLISLRGGSFADGPEDVRCAFRGRYVAGSGNFLIGFRCVRDLR